MSEVSLPPLDDVRFISNEMLDPIFQHNSRPEEWHTAHPGASQFRKLVQIDTALFYCDLIEEILRIVDSIRRERVWFRLPTITDWNDGGRVPTDNTDHERGRHFGGSSSSLRYRSASPEGGTNPESQDENTSRRAEIEEAIANASTYDRELLVEKFIAGRELTIGILGDQALPIIEIIPKGGFYDFTNKYPFLNPNAGGGAEHVCPANIPEEQTRAIQDLALRAHRSLGLKVYSRVDIILPEGGEPTVLEVNTIPGMTEVSLLPEAAAAAGISYVDLCARIIELSRAARPTR